jgi:hypothetical protein
MALAISAQPKPIAMVTARAIEARDLALGVISRQLGK